MTKAPAEDPFAHLHEEDYARPFEQRMALADTLTTLAGRNIVPLDGEWRMTLDLFDEGLRQRWFELDETPPSQWASPRDYEIEAGDLVPVPSCWNLLKPEWTHFEGAAWYARWFDWTPGGDGERVLLSFGAANYAAHVFLNGVHLGGHRGGSTPFCLEATAYLEPGRNRLQVYIENRRRADRVPMRHFDWFNYGGLYRETALIRLPAIFIRSARAALTADGAAIRFAIALSDPVDGRARVEIAELGLAADIAVVAGHGEILVRAAPQRWSPAAPRLYATRFSFAGDVVTERIGFRTLATRGTQILLNGEPVWLKGVCVHEDDLETGKTTNEADIRRRFRHARELGCNFLRLAHYPHHELVARIADEEGLWQAEFYREQLRRLRAAPYVAGLAAWLLYDFRSERRQTGFQRGFNRKGLIGADKATKKLAFAALAACYRALDDPGEA